MLLDKIVTKVTGTISAVVLLAPGFALGKSQSMTLQEPTYIREQRIYITQTPRLSQLRNRSLIYTKLETLLKAQNFREADEETKRVMLAVAKRQSEGWLRIEDAENFPCQELRAIDNLWLKYSQGKFGISVQQEIYKKLGGTKQYNEKVWISFGEIVGWKKSGLQLTYSNINFSLSAPRGHLPFNSVVIGRLLQQDMEWVWRAIGVSPYLAPVKTCGYNP